jgi:hypothetical protein
VLDALLAVFVAALAFLLASTPARNSDLWLHLASGRLLAQGRLPPGSEPFSSTTTGISWVNPAWLSDLLLYRLHALGEGRALILAKAGLVAALAGLFFCFRRPGTQGGLLALAATCAVLALSPWLLLQPVLLSLLGVVLTLYLLERPSLLEGPRAERARAWRWLPVPLFGLWANLDGWFLLGPVLVALYALGAALRLPGGARPAARRDLAALALLTLAGLAACLLTPYHYHTLASASPGSIPLGLSHAEQALMHDLGGQGLVVMRRCLLQAEASGPDPALRSLLEEHQVDRIVVYDPDKGDGVGTQLGDVAGGDEDVAAHSIPPAGFPQVRLTAPPFAAQNTVPLPPCARKCWHVSTD